MAYASKRGGNKPGTGTETPPPEPQAQVRPWGIERVIGQTATYPSNSRRVWVIDTGIDKDHPDLNVNSANFVTKGRKVPNADDWADSTGHGTHVAGTIAAIDNDIGVVGVAESAQVVAVRVLDNNGSDSYAGVIAGIDYVAANANKGKVVNMSLGGGASTALDKAVIAAADKGILFAIAAGNSSADARTILQLASSMKIFIPFRL